MQFEEFQRLCESRHSVRYFAETPVPETVVESLLHLAKSAPSVENLQPWRFHVIADLSLKRSLMQASCYGDFVPGAGVFIIVTADTSAERNAKEPVWNPQELEYSCVTAAEHMLLGAEAMGLGGCWVSLHHGTVHELLGLAINETVVCGIMIGYKRPGEEQAHPAHERRDISDSISWYR